uniref:Uncharacterized protein n=1 Tax=Oryza barthii TaxID=65489 RepID=A0A0D3G8D9_9ORYZ
MSKKCDGALRLAEEGEEARRGEGEMTLQMEPPPPPPRRSVSTSCDLHPGETFTGFCAACLRERLAGLEASTAAAAAAPGRRSTSAIRSLFSRPFVAAVRS